MITKALIEQYLEVRKALGEAQKELTEQEEKLDDLIQQLRATETPPGAYYVRVWHDGGFHEYSLTYSSNGAFLLTKLTPI